MASAVARWHAWKITQVVTVLDESTHSSVVRLTGEVRRSRYDSQPAALIVSAVQVGEAIETPLVFWTVVLLWPAPSMRRRLLRLMLAIPVFLGLEVVTTTCQLLHPLAEASALLSGARDPVTMWEQWSRFLESGGLFAVEVTAALLAIGGETALPAAPQ
jgi:hypothetical protein